MDSLVVAVSILTCILCLLKPTHSGYDGFYPPNFSVNYLQRSTSGTVRTFPNQTSVSTQEYGYFFSEFNFNIDSRLLTGAADTLYLFDLDLNVESNYTWTPTPSILSSCLQNNDNSSYTCRNHIRTYKQLPTNSSQLLVCGTQADTTPQCRIVELTGDGDIGDEYMTVTASNGLLSYFPEYTSFGEFISTDSSDRFFSAALGSIDRDYRIAFMNVSLSETTDPDTLQTSELFRTPINDRWLKFPVTFVDYYRADYTPVAPATEAEQYQFYFVFLRESLTNADVIYSRVARICRNDPGLSTTSNLGNHFTTFMKARIFCEREVPPGRQFAGSVDYNYNEIRSVTFNQKGRYSQTTEWVELMYGAFASPSIGPIGTAICAYRADNSRERGETGFNRGIFDIFREDLQDAQGDEFESTFVECDGMGRSSDDSQLIQVIQDVSQIGENPFLVLDGLIVTQMSVDQVCVVRSSGSGCLNQDILFLGTDSGKIMKVAFVGSNPLNLTPVIAEEIMLDDANAVNRMSIQSISSGSKYIYASTFSRIYRLPLERCDRLNSPNNVTNSCMACVGAQDPYCVWNMNSLTCEPNPFTAVNDTLNTDTSGYLQNVHTGTIPPECTFPEIGFQLAMDSVSESETSYTATIVSSVEGTASSGLVEVYAIPGEGNATLGEDYSVSTTGDVITFLPGSSTAEYTVTLNVMPDNMFEGGNELFTIGLRATGSGGVVISQSELTISIIEDDVVTLRLASDSLTVSERDCFVNVTIGMEGETAVDIMAQLNTIQTGSAVVGEDYLEVEQVVTFSRNVTQRNVTIPLINDNVQELEKWFLARLSLPVEMDGVVLDAARMITNITIVDDDFVVIDFLNTEFTVNEGQGTITVTLVKNGLTAIDYDVELRLLPGSAGGSDFDSSTQSVMFMAEEGRKDVTITIVDDMILEDEEAFTIELRVPAGSDQEGLTANSSATVTIIDNDSGTVGFSPTDYSAVEGSGSVTVTVELSVATEIDVVVELVTSAGTAVSSQDFNPVSTSLTFTSGGATSLPVVIPLVDDSVLELSEYFTVLLVSSSQRVTVGQSTANITILDDDVVTLGFSASDYTVSEGDRLVTLQISVVGSSQIPLNFFLSTSNGSAVSGEDYEGLSMMTVSVMAPMTSVTVRLIDDNVVEAQEQFQISLVPSDALPLARVNINRNVTSITIENDDAVMIDFLYPEFTVSEGEGSITVTLVKNGLTTMNNNVELRLVPGSAGASDFDSSTQSVMFMAEEGRKDVAVTIVDDMILEDEEDFTIELRVPAGSDQEGLTANSSARVTIIDNDSGTVGFSPTDYSAVEGIGSVTVTVELSVATEIDVVVELVTSAGTAASDLDFNPVSTSLTFTSSGATSLPVVIPLVDDSVLELSEYFTVLLVSSSQRVTVGQSTANVTILDNDAVTIGFSAPGYTVSEEDRLATVQISVAGSSQIPLNLFFTTSDDTAVSGEDYEGLSMMPVSIMAPMTSVTVRLIDDNVVETLEQFRISLVPSNDLPLARVNVDRNVTSITIENDDAVVIDFLNSEFTVSEGQGTVTVTLVKSGLTTIDYDVELRLLPGSAGASDFDSSTQSVMFMAEEGRKDVAITIVDDMILEDEEDFTIELRVPAGSDQEGLTANSSARVTIIDNDSGTVGFNPTDYSAVEESGSVTVTVELSVATEIDVVVELVTSAGTAASNQDFTPVSNSLTFMANGASSLPLVISLVNDNRLELDEYFVVQLISTHQRVSVGQAQANVTIMDDDVVSVGFGESQYSALESDGLVAIEIRLFGSTDTPLNFLLSTSDDSAVSGEDYEGFTLLPVIVPAQTTKMTVNVRLVNDDRVEDERKQFQILLRGGDNLPAARVNLNQTTTTVTVMDDDVVEFGFESVLYSTNEDDGGVDIVVVKYGNSAVPLSVRLSTANASALSSQDYTQRDLNVIFSPNDTTKSVRINLTNDDVLEEDEQFTASLSQPDSQARVLGALSSTTITITNDDSPVLAATTDAAATTSAANVNERTDSTTVSFPGPGVGALGDRCIYESFTDSAVVLAVLLAVIVALSLLFTISLCVLAKKVCNERKLKQYHYNQSDIPLTANGKRGSTPDRLPLDDFGIPNKVYRENSLPSTPATPKTPLGNDPAVVLARNGNNNNKASHYYVTNDDALEQSSSSDEDLTMSKL